jgi:hypothetical protein
MHFVWHHLPNHQVCTLVGDQEGTIAFALFAHNEQPLLAELTINPVILLHNATILAPSQEALQHLCTATPALVKKIISSSIALRIVKSHESCAIPLCFHPSNPTLLCSPGAFLWSKDSPPKFAELCCGGMGALTKACLSVGFLALLTVDNDPHCLDTFETYFSHHFPAEGIGDFHVGSTLWLYRLIGCSVIVAGILCQPHSTLGGQKHHEDDRHLLSEILDIVQFIRPAALILENVEGFYSSATSIFHLRSMVAELGYIIQAGLCNAAIFVPQSRVRCGFILMRKDVTPTSRGAFFPPFFGGEVCPPVPPPTIVDRGIMSVENIDPLEQYLLTVPLHVVTAMNEHTAITSNSGIPFVRLPQCSILLLPRAVHLLRPVHLLEMHGILNQLVESLGTVCLPCVP